MNLTDKTQKELYTLAKELNIPGRSRMNKSELLLAVSAAQNEEETFEEYTEFCKNYIIDRIDDYEGETVYMSELDSELTEADNGNGSVTYSTWKAKQYIGAWFDDMADFYEYAKLEYEGPTNNNPFEEPEKFMTEAVIEGVRNILNQCETFKELYSEEIELTPKIIKQIKKEVAEVTDITF